MRAANDRGSAQAEFLAFYDDTFDEVYRYAARLCGSDRATAEDLVQDSYASLLVRFRADGRRVLTIGYVITAVRHRFLDGVRSSEREERRLRLVHSSDDATDDARRTDVTGSLAQLPERERAALVLRYVDDLSVPEVAEAIGSTVHATESLLARARARLRSQHDQPEGARDA